MVKRRFNKCSTFQDVETLIYVCVCVCVCVCEWCLRHLRTVVPTVCSADPKGSAISPLEIRGYVSVMATLKFTLSFS